MYEIWAETKKKKHKIYWIAFGSGLLLFYQWHIFSPGDGNEKVECVSVECVCSFHFNKTIVYRYPSDWHLIQINYPFIHLATTDPQSNVILPERKDKAKKKKKTVAQNRFHSSCVRSEYILNRQFMSQNGSVFFLKTILLYFELLYTKLWMWSELSKAIRFSDWKIDEID